ASPFHRGELERGGEFVVLRRRRGYRRWVFQAHARTKQHHPLVAAEESLATQEPRRGPRRGGFWRSVDARQPTHLELRRLNVVVSDGDRRPAAVARRIQDRIVADRLRHAQTGGGR